MKYFTLLSGAAALIAYSSMPVMAESSFDGPYAGLQLGVGRTSADYSYEPGTSGNTAFSGSKSENGLNGGIFACYGRVITDKLYLGGELGYSRSSANYKETDSGVTGKIEQNETWEIGVRSGYLIQPETLIYGRLGYVKTNFKSTLSDATNSFSGDETINGIRFGAGVEQIIKENISLRLDGSFTNYSNSSFSYDTTQENVSYDLDEALIRIGAAYRF